MDIPQHFSRLNEHTPIERLVYWMIERHRIYLQRQAGAAPPWTSDPILQNYFFTNPYRENDKTTKWFRDAIREPLGHGPSNPSVLMATIIFRWFNYIPTGRILLQEDLLRNWNTERAVKVFDGVPKVFTGAFMVKSPNGVYPKVRGIGQCIDKIKADERTILQHIEKHPTLQSTFELLRQYPYMGNFMAYEVVTDLRHTYLLQKAPDINTWCSLGPGGVRGYHRITQHHQKSSWNPKLNPVSHVLSQKMPEVLSILQVILEEVRKVIAYKRMPHIEMRELEHSLCEFDKYERARLQEGKLKRNFTPQH